VRIAVVCTDLGIQVPGEKGASLHLVAIATALARAGHEVMVVGVAGHGPPPAGVRHLLLPRPRRSEGVRWELRKLGFVRRLPQVAYEPLSEFAPDIVYERLSLFGTAGGRLAAALGVPHAVEVNALLAAEQARWRGLRLERLAARREQSVLESADLRVAVSAELAARLPAPTAVVPNGVDAELFADLPERAEARRRFDLPAERRVIGFVGGLRPWHGVETAIEALPAADDVVLAVAGDGPQRGALERLAAERGVAERVRWLGRLPHEDVPAFLAALDVAVLPYPALDGFAFSPLKLYEYLAAGVPVVASDVGQVRDVLEDGRWGTLVPPGDTAALAEALRSATGSPDATVRAAEARRHTLVHHSWDERATRLGDLLALHAGALAA
jgi:glycosyltransferase involved in cell wall biosynthesis